MCVDLEWTDGELDSEVGVLIHSSKSESFKYSPCKAAILMTCALEVAPTVYGKTLCVP